MRNTASPSDIIIPEPWASVPRLAAAYRYGYAKQVPRAPGMTISGSVCTDGEGNGHLYSESGACAHGCANAKAGK